jgi:predicted Zn-dependent protease with MMP-like domain
VLTEAERRRFDAALESVLKVLPRHLHAVIEEVPVIVEDQPAPDVLESFEAEPDSICGLHSGLPLTDRSVEDSGVLPDTVHLYRRGILAAAADRAAAASPPCADAWSVVREEIRITLLHELGHHHGLDEDDLDRLGYA